MSMAKAVIEAIDKNLSVDIKIDDLIQKLEDVGLPDAKSAVSDVVDKVIFGWFADVVKDAAQKNFLFSVAPGLLEVLQQKVDNEIAKIPDAK